MAHAAQHHPEIEGTFLLLTNRLMAVVKRATDGGADQELHDAMSYVVAHWIVERSGGKDVEAAIEKFTSSVMADAIDR
jgi:hypothetical protein